MVRLVRGLHNIATIPPRAIVTIGNFDGVHLGHQALLKRVTTQAHELNTSSLVIIFEPQPGEFFAREKKIARLTRLREKITHLTSQQIDVIVVLPFNAQLAALTAEEFVQRILVTHLRVQSVIVGDDFQFGRGRQGDFTFLMQAGKQAGFAVEQMPSVIVSGERVSSTRIRAALAAGDLSLAAKLLGRPYSMQGRIVHGDKLGRRLGFPTANIFLHRELAPIQGIYVVRLHGIDSRGLPGVANVGIRPTIGGTRSLLEVHLLDFQQDIYGRSVEVEFCLKLREEACYPNLTLLAEQIAQDVQVARDYFIERGEL